MRIDMPPDWSKLDNRPTQGDPETEHEYGCQLNPLKGRDVNWLHFAIHV